MQFIIALLISEFCKTISFTVKCNVANIVMKTIFFEQKFSWIEYTILSIQRLPISNRGRSLTSPQTATTLIGLCIPLASAVDMCRSGGWWRGAAAALAAAGWVLALMDFPRTPANWLTTRLRAAEGFSWVFIFIGYAYFFYTIQNNRLFIYFIKYPDCKYKNFILN